MGDLEVYFWCQLVATFVLLLINLYLIVTLTDRKPSKTYYENPQKLGIDDLYSLLGRIEDAKKDGVFDDQEASMRYDKVLGMIENYYSTQTTPKYKFPDMMNFKYSTWGPSSQDKHAL